MVLKKELENWNYFSMFSFFSWYFNFHKFGIEKCEKQIFLEKLHFKNPNLFGDF